ncbi:MAG: outer membrane beta-barrel protein [Candidatus Neomarinimicrobiota bacterium]
MNCVKLVLVSLMATVSSAQLRVSADVTGTHEVKVLGIKADNDAGLGITIGYDHVLGGTGSIEYGAGAEYQLNRENKVEDADGGKFGFTSPYGFLRYALSEQLYGVARIGYALLFSGDDTYTGDEIDLKGGLMYGVGGGFKLNDQLSVEGGYYSNAGTGELSEEGLTLDLEVVYTRVNVGVNYTF